MSVTATTMTRSRRLGRTIGTIMVQREFKFDPMVAIAAIAIGVILSVSVSVGAGKAIDIEFLASGAFMGLCIYISNLLVYYALAPYIGRCSDAVRPVVRVLVAILAGIAGWEMAYSILAFAETGTIGLPGVSGRMRWLLLVTVAITILVAAFVQGYNHLRERLSETIEAEKELELARSIQSRLLPPSRIDGDGFVITARNVPANYVAGDFYDVLRHDDGSVGIVIADVSGKGVGASLIMASVKAMLPFVAHGEVSETLRALNERLTGQLERREFVALAYARFSPSTGKVQLANAGMPDPYLISRSVTPIVVTGDRLPLGIRRDVRYESVEVQLAPGDRLLLLSDGIPEAPRPNGEQLGYDALREMLDRQSSLNALLERIRAQVTSIDDDWTAVLLECGGHATALR
jgi:stage II sporulation SpoE-like protein